MARAHRGFLLAIIALAVASVAGAQTPRGIPNFGSYGGSSADVINLSNLNSHVTIPILHKAGRGLGANFDLTFDSTVWSPAVSTGNSVWQPASNWGWNGTAVLFGYVTHSTTTTLTLCSGGNSANTVTYANWTYSDWTGDHVFPGVSDTYGCTGTSDGGSFVSMDGTGYTLVTNGATYTLSGRGGTQITLGAPTGWTGAPTSGTETDRNGNEITMSSGVFTDTLDTKALTIAGGSPNPVTFSYTAPSGATASVTVTFKTYTVQTNFACPGTSDYGPISNSLVDKVTLPDGSAYSFQYESTPGASAGNVTGRLASMTLPTGGTIAYTYTGGSNGIVCVDGSTAGLTRKTSDGYWTYARTEGANGLNGNSVTTVTDPTAQQNQTVSNFSGIFEIQRQVYRGSATGGTLIETISNAYTVDGGIVVYPITTKTTTVTQPNGYSCATSSTYNSYGLPLQTVQYLCNGTADSRNTSYSYMSFSNNLNEFWEEVTVTDTIGGNPYPVSDTKYIYDATTPTSTSTLQHVNPTGSRANLTNVQYSTGARTLSKTISYFDTGNIHQVTDVNGGVTTYAYGDCNNSFPTQETLPVTTLSLSYVWNCTGGFMTQTTDENAKITSTLYSDKYFWRPASISDPTGATISFAYATPNTSESSLVFGSSTVDVLTTRDSFGRVILNQTKQSPSSAVYDTTETDYDPVGRPIREVLPYSASAGQLCPTCPAITTSYDPMGRPLQVTDAGGGKTTYSYNANDTLITQGPAPAGEHAKSRQIEYDALGRVISVCEVSAYYGSGSCGQTTPATGFPTMTLYGGDAYSSYQGSVPANQPAPPTPFAQNPQRRSYIFDELGRLLSFSFPETSGTNVYDSDTTCTGAFSGDLVRHSDPVGNTTCYTYDALHRPSSITYSGPYATSTPNKYFVYDAATVAGTAMSNAKGRLAEAYTATCSTCSKITDIGFSYSARGEGTDLYESTPNSGGYYHVTNQFAANGTVSQLSGLPGLPTISYALDGEGRASVVSASSGTTPVLSTVYNAASEALTVGLGSGDSDVFGYDANTYRMTQYTFNVSSKSVKGTLAWNPNGTLQNLSISDPFNAPNTQNCAYLYDDMSRVCSANCGSAWQQAFSYDQFGNISKSGSMSFQPTYNPATNQMTEVGSSAPTYDANGNVLNDFLHGYTWDAAGRPVSIDGVGVTYDALGRKVEQYSLGLYSQVVYAPTGQKLALMSKQALQKAFVPLPGGLTAVYSPAGLTYYRHPDWQGSSRFASTATQGFYSSTAYGPFGEPYAQAGTADVSFTGQNQDTSPAVYDFPAREYGIQGRWPSPDPFFGSIDATNPQSLNRYAYVANNPLNRIDPSGLYYICFPDCGGGTGGGGGSGGGGSGGGSCMYYYSGCGGGGGSNGGGGVGRGGGGGVGSPVGASGTNLNSIASPDPCDGPCISDFANGVFAQVGQETGALDPNQGLLRPGQTFNQCMIQYASTFSVGGIGDLIVGGNALEGFLPQLLVGNTFTGLYAAGAGSWDDFKGFFAGETPDILARSLAQQARPTTILTFGLSKSEPALVPLASSSGGLLSVLQGVGKVFSLGLEASEKGAIDLGLFGAEVFSCSTSQ